MSIRGGLLVFCIGFYCFIDRFESTRASGVGQYLACVHRLCLRRLRSLRFLLHQRLQSHLERRLRQELTHVLHLFGKRLRPRLPFSIAFEPAWILLQRRAAASGVDDDGIKGTMFFLPCFEGDDVASGKFFGSFDVADVCVQCATAVLRFGRRHLAAGFAEYSGSGLVDVRLHHLHHATRQHADAGLLLSLRFPALGEVQPFAHRWQRRQQSLHIVQVAEQFHESQLPQQPQNASAAQHAHRQQRQLHTVWVGERQLDCFIF